MWKNDSVRNYYIIHGCGLSLLMSRVRCQIWARCSIAYGLPFPSTLMQLPGLGSDYAPITGWAWPTQFLKKDSAWNKASDSNDRHHRVCGYFLELPFLHFGKCDNLVLLPLSVTVESIQLLVIVTVFVGELLLVHGKKIQQMNASVSDFSFVTIRTRLNAD